jgi:hypothetical protein
MPPHERGFSWEGLREALKPDQRRKIRDYLDSDSHYGPAARILEKRLEVLGQVVQAGEVVLVLGAGVGVSTGLPSWDQLLSRLLLEALTSKLTRKASPFALDPSQVPALLEAFDKALDETSPLVLARFAQFEFEENKDNNKSRKGALVELIAAVFSEVEPRRKPSALIDALMASIKSGAAREVVNYNFDDSLERALVQAGWRDDPSEDGTVRTYKTDGGEPRSVRILYVHGRLKDDSTGKEVVFTEPDYHRQYGDPYSWSNLTQLNAFTSRSCVFVGVSLTDPNMRRLLEAARIARGKSYGPEEGKPHFAFLRRTDAKEIRSRLASVLTHGGEALDHPDRTHVQDVDAIVGIICELADAARDAALEALGVQVLWFSAFDELPGLLGHVRRRPVDAGVGNPPGP